MGGISVHPIEPQGPPVRALAPCPWLRSLLQRGTRQHFGQVQRNLQDPRAVSGPALGEPIGIMNQPFRLSSGGRSLKYHRPRGILSAGPEEPNALFAIDRGDGRFDPNTRATQIALWNGL